MTMRVLLRTVAALAVATACLGSPGLATARGCVAGAATGGVVGHVAGHHAILGAAAGCAINHHRDAVKDRKAAAAAAVPPAAAPPPPATAPTR
jgi:hypothetical protein